MNITHSRITLIAIVLTCCAVISTFASSASADHSWGGYHWARTTNPFTVKVGDNLSGAWKPFLVTTAADWTLSSALDVVVVSGQAGRKCRATPGRVEICNNRYGNNGWLGIASIWVSGTHITQATVKLNDTYFTKAQYNTAAWKNLVMCQEVGHTFGLDHQDENFTNANLSTCMDYTNNPLSNQHPNVHDYEELDLIYAHLDTITTLAATTATAPAEIDDTDNPSQWGREVARSHNSRDSVFEEDRGNGQKVLRHVFWAEPRGTTRERE